MREVAFDAAGSMVRWTEIPGREPARVFVHGLGGTGAGIFGEVAAHPRLGGHRTLVVDLPGHGHSDRPRDWAYSLDDHAGAITAVCRAAGISGIDLVGHSLGGDVSIVVGARTPGLVARLVICEANLDPLPVTADGERFSQRIAAQGEEAFVSTGYAAVLAAVPAWRPTLRLAAPWAVYRSARELLAGTRPTMRELFSSLQIPRTIIVGELGEPLLGAAALQESGVRLVRIPAAGHVMMLDAPEAFLDELVMALEEPGPP